MWVDTAFMESRDIQDRAGLRLDKYLLYTTNLLYLPSFGLFFFSFLFFLWGYGCLSVCLSVCI